MISVYRVYAGRAISHVYKELFK